MLALFPVAASTQVVKNTLADWLRQVFPEMNRGYSDLSSYDTLDQTDDLNHRLTESTIADARVQGTEILDFSLDNVLFLVPRRSAKGAANH